MTCHLLDSRSYEKLDRTSNLSLTEGFEKNVGQVNGEDKNLVDYFFKSNQLTIFLTKKGIVYQFEKWNHPKSLLHDDSSKLSIRETHRMDMELIGANTSPITIEEDASQSYTHYYNRNLYNVKSYKKIIYKNIYPSIDWVIYHTADPSQTARVKYDFIVHPGGKPEQIRFKLKWTEASIGDNGSLHLKNELGEVDEERPICFQYLNGEKTAISSSFSLENNEITFKLGSYDLKKSLIIDPILQWATYYGGSGTESGGYTTIDGSGNVYLCGSTVSSTAIASGGHQTTIGGSNDAFLAKFNSAGVRQWATYYGGSDDDRGTHCHVDKSNNVYLAGRTLSTSGIASGGHQTAHGGDYDAFVVKFNPAGTRQWATYYGGSNIEEHVTCAVDTGLNVYLAGTTQSNNNIFSSGGFQNTFGGFSDAFLVKFNSAGVRQWGTFYGGTALDEGGQCAVDKSGNVYLGGTTRSTTNISGSGFQNTKNNLRDGFLIKFNSNGTRAWGTYYGGDQDDYGNSVSVDTLLNVYLSGFTYSTGNIASGGFQNTFGGSNDAYLVKFNTSGARLWGTYYGGSNGDYGPHCITDKYNNVYLTGYTLSTNSIAAAGLFNTSKGNIEGFIVKFNPSGGRYWGSYYGGSDDDYMYSSAPDGFGNVYYSGQTLSNAQIASSGHQNTFGGAGDVFLVKMSEDPIPYIEIFSSKGDTICQGDSILFTKNEVNGGTTPRYRWFRNNVLVDTTSSYTATGFNTGDSVKCMMISNAPGLLYDTAWSLAIKFFVHPKKFTTLNVSICRPQTYYFKSQMRNTSGIYIDTLVSAKGCDSIITLNLTVKDTASFNLHQSICSNSSYYFNGAPRTTAGVYKDTLISANGCDSFLYLILSIKNTSSKTIDTAICSKNPYFFKGQWRSISGTYLDTLPNAMGCDSFITLNLTVKPNSSKTIDTAICNGKTYWFKGQNRNATGIYKDTLTNSIGCDSFITLNLTVKAISYTNLNVTICDNQSYTFKGIPRTVTGIYKDTMTNIAGCDSIITLNLTVSSRTYKTIFDTICSNSMYLFDGNYLNTSGIYHDTLLNSKNCDSIITLHLLVKNTSSHTINQTICSNSSYFFNGNPRTTAGTYLDTLLNSNGCDSFITLNLTVNSISSHLLNQEICLGDSFLFNGVYRKTPGLYKDTLINQFNCDSFLNLNLVVRNPSFHNFSIIRCKNNPYVFKNTHLYVSGIYRDTLQNRFGCDSFVTLNYTSKDTSSFSFSTSICQGGSVLFNGIPRTTSGTYTLTAINTQGCDSIVSMTLTVYPTYSKTIDTSVCIGSSVFFKGNFIMTPGIYIDTLKTIHNCDSIITLKLTNYPPTYHTIYRKFCFNSGVWFNGVYRKENGTYLDTLVNSKGCDSFLTMVLYKDTVHTQTIFKSICSYDSIYFGDKYIKTAGIYNYTFKNGGGCDSIVTLNLTINNPKPISIAKYNAFVLISELGFKNYSWYLNKVLIPKEKRHYIEIQSTGTYFVRGIDSNDCTVASNELYMEHSSIKNQNIESITVFPIPIRNKVYIKLSTMLKKTQSLISIFDIYGRRVYKQEFTNSPADIELDLSQLSNGNYLLRVNSAETSFERNITISK